MRRQNKKIKRQVEKEKFEWRFYAQSASEAILIQGENIQSYNLFRPVMMVTWWMKLGGNRPPGHDVLFDKWHVIFYMPSRTETAGHTKALYLPSRTDTAGHTKAFIYPVA